jgi:hypothetical protein
MGEGYFEAGGLRFERDTDGAALDGNTEEILCDLDPESLGLDPESLLESMEDRLGLLLGEPYEDDEGMYEFVALKDGKPVACFVVSCEEDDTLSLAGERLTSMAERTIVSLFGKALATAEDEDDED